MGTLDAKARERLDSREQMFSPREQGAIAYIEGKSMDENPYSPMEIDHDDWRDGYACEVEFVSNNFDACFGESNGSA